MRVLFVNGRPDAQQNPGGDTVQLLKTKAALEKIGVAVEVRSPDNLFDLPPCDVAHVFNIQMPYSSLRVVETIREKRVPIVLSPIYWDLYDYWCQRALGDRLRWQRLSRILGTTRVRWLYANWQRWKAPFKSWWRVQRRLLQETDRVLPNSQSEADLLQKTFRLDETFQEKVDVVPNAIDPTLYRELPEPSQVFQERYGIQDFVLQVGTIHPVKNQLGLIEALYDTATTLVFVGPTMLEMSEYAQHCHDRAVQRGNVVFAGRVPHEELPRIYALASVHVLPSWRETPGLVSLEAAAAGCRIVSTSIGSARDYFGDLASYCHPSDPESIRSAVETALRSSSSPGLRQRVLANFTWERAGEASLVSYEKTLNGEGS